MFLRFRNQLSLLKIRPTSKVSLAAGMLFSAFSAFSRLSGSQDHPFSKLSQAAKVW